MRIPEEKIEEIRNSANIVDIISGYVQLKKRGKNYVGLCPFHQEKTPSFTVSEDKQIFHCFGCHAGGNVYKFLMDYKNISFVESVQEIADYLGIKLELQKGYDSQKQMEQEAYYEINVLAAKFFSENLFNNLQAEFARDYLSNRNIKLQTQKQFGLGYAPPGWDTLLKHLKDNDVDLKKAHTLGLIDISKKDEYYDKFRDRIIFPIFSPNGRVIAFGGRILDSSEKTAKYLNSPESLIYLKRKSLYGLFHSKEEIRKLDKAILVEGYMDLISLFQHGIKNVVASSGTSLTEEQVQLLSRFTKNIVILFDADAAGEKASMRSIEILLKQDFDVKLVALPSGEDPDSYVNKYGKDQFEEVIMNAKDFLEYKTSQFAAKGMFEDPKQHTEAIRELVKTAALVSDELKRNLLIKSIAKKFGLREKLIESELDKYLQQLKRRDRRIPDGRPVGNKTLGERKKENEVKKAKKEIPHEKDIIRLLFSGEEEIVKYIFKNIEPAEFVNEYFKKFAGIVYESYESGDISISGIIDKLDDEKMKNFVFKITLGEESISKKWDEFTYDGKIEKDSLEYAKTTVRNYKIYKIDQLRRENERLIAGAQNEEEILELWKKDKELIEEKKFLLNGNGE